EAARDTTKLNTEAESARKRQLALADADATKSKADGDAHAARVVADADAEAINARAQALMGEHQELIAANKLIDMLPQLVDAAARGIQGSRLTVLNGAQGVGDVATGVVAQGLSIYDTLRASISRETESLNGDGAEHEAEAHTLTAGAEKKQQAK